MDVVVVGAGISGLATGYFLQRAAEKHGLPLSLRVLDASQRVGGKIESLQRNGFLVEAAANAWLSSKLAVGGLTRELGLTSTGSSPEAEARFVLRKGKLRRVPMGPVSFLGSALLSPRGKLGVLGEPFAKPAPDRDESVADFVRRRLGDEILDRLVDPFVSGVFAGDPALLSVESAFPKLKEMEARYNSLIRGMFLRARAGKGPSESSSPSSGPRLQVGPAGGLVSLPGGMQQLCDALRTRLDDKLDLGKTVESVTRKDSRWRLRLLGGGEISAEGLVLAVPAYAAAQMLMELDPALSGELAGIVYNSVAVIALGWKLEQVPHPLDGFGFLIPWSENRKILGSLWESSLFAGRAPAGHVLLRTMVGGTRRPEMVALSDDELISTVRHELGQILGIQAAPAFVRVVRHPRAIPQYHLGHGARLGRIQQALQGHVGLFLTGNAYRGISLDDCVTAARSTAESPLSA